MSFLFPAREQVLNRWSLQSLFCYFFPLLILLIIIIIIWL